MNGNKYTWYQPQRNLMSIKDNVIQRQTLQHIILMSIQGTGMWLGSFHA